VLVVRDLQVYYGSSHIVQGCSLTVNAGELVCLLGRNGAGKSTTVYSITGIVPARSGYIQFETREISRLPIHRRARRGLGLVPQGRRVFPLLSVEETLEVGARRVDGGWTLERVYHLFPPLYERRRNYGNQLSGGEQQMLALGRALMTNPKLLLLDEPSEGLAPRIVDTMYETIGDLKRQGLAILLVEHSLRDAIDICNRFYIMNRGTVVFEGCKPADLTDEIRERYLGVG
jgi:branched-chain amino acid transport system ATP-binding protein